MILLSLADYNNTEQAKISLLQAIKAKLEAAITIENLSYCVKAIEVLEDVEHLAEFTEVLALIPTQVQTLASSSLTGESMMLLSRAMKLADMPYGTEQRWQLKNYDEGNTDWQGDIIIGERTLESFNDKLLETFYL